MISTSASRRSGHKYDEGDGRTPEGTYLIDRRNPNSKFHLSIGISYPNAVDRAQASRSGKSPGGDIFIHGQPNGGEETRRAATGLPDASPSPTRRWSGSMRW